MAIEIKKIKERVKQVLELHPETRNSDLALFKRIWFEDKTKLGANFTIDFLEQMSQGRMTHPVSIVRCRRLLQKHFPELQGTNEQEKWDAQEPVKHDVRTFLGES